MPADSWIAPDDVPALAAEAIARIDGTLSRLTDTDRDAFWASVRKCYNTPYNDPKPRALPRVRDLAPDLAPVAPEPQAAQAEASTGLGAALSAALAAIPVPGAFPSEAHAV
ncbi:hypothetical protein [Methylobacterium sp. J-068]|uniref:hypothetical protein n=1 Tax=Methylobacterium sp. J-068 TaxID=2836649 RepID=UPI001FB967C7|nr:hypothetical protein [Methylobacterium sp. J-068]MCJ2036362.1 hypothetical protein [Methylobacterium sp. J-068]